MHLLLDTHLLVWAMGSPERLPSGLIDPDFSVQPGLLRRTLLESGWQELPVQAHHVFNVADLPPLHRDPFDRLLLAQAKAEGLLLITADQQLAAYPGPIRWMT
jgi:PIN domain nuclease of toxin-antitoxin system